MANIFTCMYCGVQYREPIIELHITSHHCEQPLSECRFVYDESRVMWVEPFRQEGVKRTRGFMK